MLKVLKYDLKYIFKGLGSFYFLTIFFAIIIRVLFIFENSMILHIAGIILGVIMIVFICITLFINILRLWMRFIKNIYGDESYLTHTLPLEKDTIYISKFLSTIVSFLATFSVILIALFVAFYSKSNFEFLKETIVEIADLYDSAVWMMMATIIFIFLLEILTTTLAGYTGILLGHRSDNNRIAKSIFWGIIISFIVAISMLTIVFGLGLFYKDIMDLFFTNQIVDVGIIKSLLLLMMILYLLLLFIYYACDLYIFKKGINVD